MKIVIREIYHARHEHSPAGRFGYVGCSRYGMVYRRSEHEKFARLGFNNSMLGKALRKYPRELWVWTVLETGITTDEDMYRKEQEWIKRIGTRSGYNCTDGGEGCAGMIFPESAKDRLRQINRGKKHSAETRAKMSIAQRDREYGPEWSAMMSALAYESIARGTRRGKLGKRVSQETIAKISAAQKGRPKSEEAKANMRAAYAKRRDEGRLFTPAVNAMIAANFAKGRTAEVRRKVGAILSERARKGKAA